MRRLVIGLAVLMGVGSLPACCSGGSSSVPVTPRSHREPAFPIRAAFYYPWFPEAWDQSGVSPYTRFDPTAGLYDSGDASVIAEHIEAMRYADVDAGIASWWGPGHPTDGRIDDLLAAAAGTGFRWALYYEAEGYGDPTPERIRADLLRIAERYASRPEYLRVGGRFVVFVYAEAADGCGMARRWEDAEVPDVYLVLKVFAGSTECPAQPDAWHQYGPAVASEPQLPWSVTISPGFWKADEPEARLSRDPTRWEADVQAMVASGAQWELITTFNEWGEGTAVESASEWASGSGYGTYLDVLHDHPTP